MIKRFLVLFSGLVVLGVVIFSIVQIQGRASRVRLKDFAATEDRLRYQSQVNAIDESWKFIREGNNHFQSERYQEAALAYERAYHAGGEKVFSGLKLAKSYEQLGEYDKALALLKEMKTNLVLNQAIASDINSIQTRLQERRLTQNRTSSEVET